MFKLFKKKKNPERKTENLKISVIMPVFLGDYKGCAKNRNEKFKRAVISFTQQTYKNSELIIVSDGCDISQKIYNDYLVYPNIKFIRIDKQPLFSGNVREKGLEEAKGDIVCYLDSDDILGFSHLETIANNFSNNKAIDWAYFNDLLLPPNTNASVRDVNIAEGSVGTSSIAHRHDCNVSWKGCDGYGHDWSFIKQMLNSHPSYKKIMGAEYYVCHLPNIFDN